MTLANGRIAVVIASLGRAEEVGDLIAHLETQSRPPDRIVLSLVKPSDAPDAARLGRAEITYGAAGLTTQRNRGLDAVLADCEFVVFFDDDYLPAHRALEGIAAFFDAHGDVVGIDGHLIADGIKGPGLTQEEAERLIAAFDAGPAPPLRVEDHPAGLYGCNMAYRSVAIADLRFDEILPRYGWQEDIDFAAQAARRGRIAKTTAFAGVHRGVKKARSPGLAMGYSQIANQIYLMRKGTMPIGKGLKMMAKNMLANHGKAAFPEPWVDRWGRTRGNWRAIRHLLTGRLDPRAILDF